MITLMPRLPRPAAEQMLDKMFAGDDFHWAEFSAGTLPDSTRFAATGGSAIVPARLGALRSEITALASAFGFGANNDRTNRAGFDAALAPWLAETGEFLSGESLRDDMWCFLAVAIVPDIVHWRFGPSRERYLGGVRNCFQRVWLRAHALDRGPDHQDRWGLLDQLTEDALVQITERPSLGADPLLARALAEGWVRTEKTIGRGRMEAVMRLATLRMRMRNEVQALSLLDENELANVVDTFFEAAANLAANSISKQDSPAIQPSDSVSISYKDRLLDAPVTANRRKWAIWGRDR